MAADPELRTLYRLVRRVDGAALREVDRAITRRRRQLEDARDLPSVFELAAVRPRVERPDARWKPEPEKFRPAPAAVAELRRESERRGRAARQT